jgi:predicted nuclease with TOPRIM domain
MGALAIREKLQEYIRIADDKKVKAIFTMIESDLQEFEWWKDEKLLKVWEKEHADYKSGKDKGYSLEEMNSKLDKAKKKRMLSK